jgi:hypothetical protein
MRRKGINGPVSGTELNPTRSQHVAESDHKDGVTMIVYSLILQCTVVNFPT